MKQSLEDFLKCKKVRCVDVDVDVVGITTGKVYDVIGLDSDFIHLIDDDGDKAKYLYCRFEPVLGSAENQLQNIELTPEVQAVEPKFKVGDKVYFSTDPDIKTISEVGNDNDVQFVGEFGWASGYSCCHATQENYEILCKLYPHIEFEKPTKELTGSDLCRAMLDKGWVSVPCYISDESDYEADNNAFCALIGKFDKCFKELDTNYEHEYAVPFDPRTGEPLTEAVLDE